MVNEARACLAIKSIEVWLQVGDRNTKFFHASTVASRKWNLIAALRDDNGFWLETQTDIGTFLVKKFNEVFHTDPVEFCDRLSDFIPGGVCEANRCQMEAIPIADEI